MMSGETTGAATGATDRAAIPVACRLDDPALARRSDQVRRELFAGAEERVEVPGGYAFRFPGDGDWAERVATFVAAERRCCPFLRIDVTYEPGLGPIRLRLTGPEGAGAFIDATF